MSAKGSITLHIEEGHLAGVTGSVRSMNDIDCLAVLCEAIAEYTAKAFRDDDVREGVSPEQVLSLMQMYQWETLNRLMHSDGVTVIDLSKRTYEKEGE